MTDVPPAANPRPGARIRLLEAALRLVRERGYAATTVEDLCTRAGVTKGAFFHHFASKEALGVAAANQWTTNTRAFFAEAPYRAHADPLERVLGYLDFRKAILRGELPEFTCFAGTLVQEVFGTSAPIRTACEASITGHAAEVAADIAAAMERHGVRAGFTAESLALHSQAVLQGAFILAKATGRTDVAVESIEHLRRYVELLFQPTARERKDPP
ncbi:MAG: TetR/AcrR family transcriptional regulator [Proteobacteria bacterium]|nr:TetR/AcrR family transcriptional regulator [Pseudomonadota bacterium]